MKSSFFSALFLLSSASAFALPAKFLPPDSSGRPQIQITNAGQYYLFRAADAYEISCDSRWYTTVVAANGKSWCRTLSAYPQNSIIVDPLPFDAIAENSPAEFEYMASTTTDINSAIYLGWAPRIAVDDPDPVASWLQKINTRYGISIGRASIPDTASPLGNKSQITVNYGSGDRTWLIYHNNKYIALFNENGALMGLTHRTYGMEFINSVNRLPQNSYAYLINIPFNNQYGQTSMGSSTSFTSVIASDGSLVLDWPNLFGNGFHVTVTWNLKSISDASSSSGLNGKIAVVTSSTAINYVAFPFVYGLSFGAGKETVVPRQNSGKVYISPVNTAGGTAGVVGEYPSANWQAQFFSIKDGAHSLYVAAEDVQQSPKNFHAYAVTEGSAGYNDFYHFPLDGAVNVSTNYSIVLSPIVGSWEQSAKKYQLWASKQKWNSDGLTALSPISARPIPTSLKAGAFWWTSFYSGGDVAGLPYRQRPSFFLNHSNVQKNLVGPNSAGGNVRAAFHVYNWWDNGNDINFPLYVPSQDLVNPSQTWPQSISSVQSDGSLLALYINATLTDIGNATTAEIPTYDNVNLRTADTGHCLPNNENGNGWWGEDFPNGSGNMLSDSMLKGRNGLPYVACFASQRLFALMDPSASYWQTVTNNNVSTVFNMGAGGIYLDSFAAANANRASYANPTISGHPQGYGSWYRNGLQQIGAKTIQNGFNKEQTNPVFSESGVRRFTNSEYLSEATIPYVDVVMNYEDAKPMDLPVVQSIYNQYQIMVGQRALVNSDAVRKAIFGRSFVWGYQLGPVETYLVCPGSNCSSPSSQEFLNYARVLEQARENLQLSPIGFNWNTARFVGLADDIASSHAVNFSGVNDWCYDPDDEAYRAKNAQPCPANLPAVRGALWSFVGVNGADYLILTNTTGSTVADATISVPKTWASANLVYQSTSGPQSYVTPFNGAVNVYMPANSVAVYRATVESTKANQYISVTTAAPQSAAYGTTFSVAAISSSGLPVAITVSGGCTIVGSSVTMTSYIADCVVNYDQLGDSNYSAATRASSTTTTATPHGLTGTYYNNKNLENPFVLTRTDPAINFNWGLDSPAAGVVNNYFSVRWSGKVLPPMTGNYKFCTATDDGARLFINGVRIINKWVDQAEKKWCGTATLTQNQPVTIQMDYYDAAQHAVAKLSWAYPTGNETQTIVPTSQLYIQ